MASAFSPPVTTVMMNSNYFGSLSDGGTVYTAPNPQFSFSVSQSNNSTWLTTEYKFGSNGTLIQYNGTFTYQGNHSSTFALLYRSNSSTGLENWKTLNVIVDATTPQVILSSNNSTLEYSRLNPNNILISQNSPLSYFCEDADSGVDNITAFIGNSTFYSNTGFLQITAQQVANLLSPNGTNLNVRCSNRVGLISWQNQSVELDQESPILTVSEVGMRFGVCVESGLKIYATAQDNQSTSTVQYLQQTGWSTFLSPTSYSNGFNSTVQLRAIDGVGLTSSHQNISLRVDDAGPEIGLSNFNPASITISVNDSCGVDSTYVRWETTSGVFTSWTLLANSSLNIPSAFNGTLVRVHVNATDMVGNSNTTVSSWSHTYGSLPSTQLQLLSNSQSTYASPQFRAIISPQGHQSSTTWSLMQNNVSVLNGSTSNAQNIAYNFSHADSILLYSNTTGAFGQYENKTYSWTVDGANLATPSLSISGAFLNTPSPTLGPNSQLTHGVASDDAGGVGGHFVECSHNGTGWWLSNGGPHLPQAIQGGTSFIFGCRSVDKLGNRGPAAWLNGSLDNNGPNVTVQPSVFSTIGPSTPIILIANDISGVSNLTLLVSWENGSDTRYSNTTQGGSNFTFSPSQLFPAIGDGTLKLTTIMTDILGNTRQVGNLQWTVNVSLPYASLAIVNGSGLFIPYDSAELRLSPPVSWSSTLSMSYSLETTSSTLYSGNTSNLVVLFPQFTTNQFAWLNVSTLDNTGKQTTQSWRLVVDGTVGTQPMFRVVNQNLTLNGTTVIGPYSSIQVLNAVDDSAGAGGVGALCSLDGSSLFNVTNGGTVPLSTNSGTFTQHSLVCKNRDVLGNIGPETWMNFSLDEQFPSQSILPMTAYLAPNQTLMLSAADNHTNVQSILYLQWSNGSSTIYRNITFSMGYHNITMRGVFGPLPDGLITATFQSFDELGNGRVTNQLSWFLSTHEPDPDVSVSGNVIGTLLGKGNVSLTFDAEVGGSGSYFGSYNISHSNGSVLHQGNLTSSTTILLTNLSYGQIQILFSITDSFGRTQQEYWYFTVDDHVSTRPQFRVLGLNTTSTTPRTFGPQTLITLFDVRDDTNGVGLSHAECKWNNSAWFTYTVGSNLSLSYQTNAVVDYSITCRNLDLLGNIGPESQLNFTMDTAPPTVTFFPTGVLTVSPSTLVGLNATDATGIHSSTVSLSWSNGISTQTSTSVFSGAAWTTTIQGLLSNTTDGEIELEITVYDLVGNQRVLSNIVWNLNTTQPSTTVQLNGNFHGAYIGSGNISFTLNPNGVSPIVTYRLSSSPGWAFHDGVANSTRTLYVNNFTEGMVWMNTSTTDVFGRFQNQSFVYEIDQSVNSTPILALQGPYMATNTSVVIGPNGGYRIQSYGDDAWGVGGQHVSCSWNGGSWFVASLTNTLSPPSISNSVTGYNLRCRNVDLLDNSGPIVWMNGSFDVQQPQVSFGTLAGVPLSSNSQINASCSDSSGCELLSVIAFFSVGTQQTNFTRALSSNTTSFPLSQLLNVTSQGAVQFRFEARDSLNNTRSLQTSSYLYVHHAPTVAISVSTAIYEEFVSENLTISLFPTSGWNSGLELVMTASYGDNGSIIRNLTINSTNRVQSFSNLAEGNVWLNTSLCNILNNCTQSSILLVVDSTGPLTPSLNLTTGTVLVNGSRVASSSAMFNITNGEDWGAGTSSTSCSTTATSQTSSANGALYSIGALVPANQWATITCTSTDRVGNLGQSKMFLVHRDDLKPVLNSTLLPNDGVITPGWYLNASCSDAFDTEMIATFRSGGQVLAQLNSSTSLSVLADNLFGTIPYASVQYSIDCEDSGRNQNTTQYNFEWLPFLGQSALSVASVQHQNQHFVSNSTTIQVSHARADVVQHVRLITSNESSDWATYNENFQFDELNFSLVDSVPLRVQARVSRPGSSLANFTLSPWFVVDNLGPDLTLPTFSWYGNSTKIPVLVNDTGVGFDSLEWSFDNGSLTSSGITDDVVMSSGTGVSVWFNITAIDRLGNRGLYSTMQLYRDLSLPTVMVEQSHAGFIGLNTSYHVNFTTTTGLKSTSITIQTPANTTYSLSNFSGNFSFSSSSLPAWVLAYNQVMLVIQATEESQLTVREEFELQVDLTRPTVGIDASQSVNISGFNTSNFSSVHFSLSSDVASLCYRVGSTTSSMSGDCQLLNSSFLQINRVAGNYLLYLKAIDQAGNSGERWITLTHFVQGPPINLSLPSIVRPTQTFTVISTSEFSPEFELTLGNTTIQNSQGQFVIPNVNGNYTLLILATDFLGLQSTESYEVTVDGTPPSISIEGWRHNGTMLGTNTTIWLNATDSQSPIKELQLTVANTSSSCQNTLSPQTMDYAVNGTLQELLDDFNCPVLVGNGVQITVNLSAEDLVGNVMYQQYNAVYYGMTGAPTFTTLNVHSVASISWVGPASKVECNEFIGTINPTISLTWTGQGGSIQQGIFENATSSGILTCQQQDDFGNTAQSFINLTYDSSAPIVNVTWPTGSSEPFVKASGPSFTIASSDGQVPISTLRYCMDVNPCTPLTNSTGNTQFNTTSGGQYLVVFTESLVGISSVQSTFFVLDNQPPSLNITASGNTSINGTIVYTGIQNSTMDFVVGDALCFHSATVRYDSGTTALENWTLKNLVIPASSTFLEIYAMDCVGHSSNVNYTVQRLTSITTNQLTVSPNSTSVSFLQGNVLAIKSTSSLSIMVPHAIGIELDCSSITVTIACETTESWNDFLVNVSAANSGFFNLTFTDVVGNRVVQTYVVDYDSTPPLCTPINAGYMNGSWFVVSSTFQSQHRCEDNKNDVIEVYWEHQGNKLSWTKIGEVWFAPIPTNASMTKVSVDRLQNVRSEVVNFVLDSSAPTVSLSDTAFLSFDEQVAGYQGRFSVSCADSISQTCLVHVRQTDANGLVLWEQNFTDNGEVTLQPLPSHQQLRLFIQATDGVGHQRSFAYLLNLDDVRPEVEVSWKNGNTGVELNGNVIPSTGVIEINGILQSGVNRTTSTLEIRCLDNNLTLLLISLPNAYDLSSLDLAQCAEISLLIEARDHVGNVQSIVNDLKVDHVIPLGKVTFEDECWWGTETEVDLAPDCDVYISVVDDEDASLRGHYALLIYNDTGGLWETLNVSRNATLSLPQFVGGSVNLLLQGTDRVGNTVQWKTLVLHVRAEMVPSWSGVRCLEVNPCPFGEHLVATYVSTQIGLGVNDHHAPIVDAKYTFTSVMGGEVQLNSPIFTFDALPDGRYFLNVELLDAAGRTLNTKFNFTYDTQAPELTIGSNTVGYYEENQSVLGCNVCQFVYRYDDLTAFTTTQNLNLESPSPEVNGGYSTINLRGLSQTAINISVTDAFQRTSWLNLTVLPLSTTTIGHVELFTDGKVNIFCAEGVATEFEREITCLWRKEGLGTARVPLPLNLTFDEAHSRSSELRFTLDGIDQQSIPLQSGTTVHYLNAYTRNVLVEVVDNFSNVKPLRIHLLEHETAWASINFVTNELAEVENETDVVLQLSPPPGHGKFYLMNMMMGTGILFDCTVEYTFLSLDRLQPTRASSDSCTIAEAYLKNGGDLELTVSINHSRVRSDAGLFDHSHALVNLDSFALLLRYADVLGLEEELNRNDLVIEQDSIERAPDSPALYTGDCMLGYAAISQSKDGFLQSDVSLPLEQCLGTFFDEDGIHSTVWNMTFFNTQGVEIYTFEIQCDGTSFPQSWAFADAFNSGQCVDPGVPFPSGTYDVRIRPLIRDYSVYNLDGEVDKAALAILGSTSQCTGTTTPCFVEVTVRSVTVYPSFNPAIEVKNAQDFIETWSMDFGPGFVMVNSLFLAIIGLLWYRSRRYGDSD